MFRSLMFKCMLLGAAAVFFTACNKEEDTKAVITITRDGRLVQGAYVKLYATPMTHMSARDYSRLFKEGLTDAKGQVTFDYTGLYEQGQSGLAVLDIASYKDSAVGYGIIRIREEEVNTETVELEFAY